MNHKPPLPFHLLRRLATPEEMRAMDQRAIQQLGLPGRLLMENAANAVARHGADLAPANQVVVVVCGPGNNGGDGYAAARLLANRGLSVRVVALGKPQSQEAQDNKTVWELEGPVIHWDREKREARIALHMAGMVVDSLFGVGLDRPLEGNALSLLEEMNHSPAPVKLAVDIPSGLDGLTGQVVGGPAKGGAFQATHTVTFQVDKLGLHQQPAASLAGQVWVEPISVPAEWPKEQPANWLLTRPFAKNLLPKRPAAGHKGSFGHLLVVGGSAGMGGAAKLAGMGGLKSGCGLATCLVPAELRDAFLSDAPELMTLAPEGKTEGVLAGAALELALQAAQQRQALVVGPGLGRHPLTTPLVEGLLGKSPAPLLVDADGLYHLAPKALANANAPLIITPHPGELARLSGLSVAQIQANRPGMARRLAQEWNCLLVLKGAATLVATPQGELFVNPTGDHGLATGGTGDVLSGLIGGLLAQGLEPLPATLLGVYLHGLARDQAAPLHPAAAFTASDLLAALPAAFAWLEKGP